MPGFGQVLTDSDIASILSYIRKRWGKSTPPIAPVTVGWVRAANPDRTIYWTVEELLRNP
jgi:mono/diheme cytochrome c family protein